MTMPRELRHVKQPDYNGCAIASTAIVCGMSYRKAKKKIAPSFFDEDCEELMLTAPEIQKAIKRFGYHAEIKTTNYTTQKSPTIYFYNNFWGVHTVVWDPCRQAFLDPGSVDPQPPHNNSHYLSKIKESNYAFIVVTGPKKHVK